MRPYHYLLRGALWELTERNCNINLKSYTFEELNVHTLSSLYPFMFVIFFGGLLVQKSNIIVLAIHKSTNHKSFRLWSVVFFVSIQGRSRACRNQAPHYENTWKTHSSECWFSRERFRKRFFVVRSSALGGRAVAWCCKPQVNLLIRSRNTPGNTRFLTFVSFCLCSC